MYILGINAYMHDASACLLKNNEILAYAEEERFNRQKHTSEFPYNAINFCLEEGSININDIQHIGFFWKPLRHLFYLTINNLHYFPKGFIQINSDRRKIFFNMLKIEKKIRKEYRYINKFHFLHHQICHAACAFFTSPYRNAAIFVIEANSERETTFLGLGTEEFIKKIITINYPNSIGLLYLCTTEYLGFKENSGEGKVMGLAAYGKPIYVDTFKDIIRFNTNGDLKLNMSYFDVHLEKKEYVTNKFIQLFGPRRKPEGAIEKRHMDIASSLQTITEETCLNLVEKLYSITKTENLCMSGGVALNSVMNGKIQQYSNFKNIHIPPVSSDMGTSLGAALLLNAKYNRNHSPFVKNFSPFLGPQFSDLDIERSLKSNNIQYRKTENITNDTANEIAKGKIIGWFQGRMEIGPRALGNRSIIVDPRNYDIKDILNLKVKHRESFRPFAPSVIIEKADEYFDTKGIEVPYMLKVFDVNEKRKAEIPAVTHIDGTARIQTVRKEDNPLYWELINKFYKITGCPVILNTSFNIRGDPIVCTPQDAIDCFNKTEIDILSIGSFICFKRKE